MSNLSKMCLTMSGESWTIQRNIRMRRDNILLIYSDLEIGWMLETEFVQFCWNKLVMMWNWRRHRVEFNLKYPGIILPGNIRSSLKSYRALSFHLSIQHPGTFLAGLEWHCITIVCRQMPFKSTQLSKVLSLLWQIRKLGENGKSKKSESERCRSMLNKQTNKRK